MKERQQEAEEYATEIQTLKKEEHESAELNESQLNVYKVEIATIRKDLEAAQQVIQEQKQQIAIELQKVEVLESQRTQLEEEKQAYESQMEGNLKTIQQLDQVKLSASFYFFFCF